jgi:hypothetical protein
MKEEIKKLLRLNYSIKYIESKMYQKYNYKYSIKEIKEIIKEMQNKLNVIKESLNERFSTMASVDFLIDQLSNSMEYYDNAEDFADHIYNETGNQNLNALKKIYNDYWKLHPSDRVSPEFDWEEWLYKYHTKAINENTLNESKNNYAEYFFLYKDLLDNYDFQQGEEVTLQHKTWNNPRTMIVTKPGFAPTLEAQPITINLSPGYFKDYLFILPYSIIEEVDKLIKDYKKGKRSPRKITEKTKIISKNKYWKILNEFTDPGDEGDPFENEYTFEMALTIYDSFPEVISYIKKEYQIFSKNDIVERIQWDLESLL